MFKRFVIVGIIIALLATLLIGFDLFKKKMMGEIFAQMAIPQPVPVSTTLAEKKPVPQRLEGIGSLEAVRQVVITPEVGGKITDILFEAGTSVKQGTPLVQINDASERADKSRYEAQARLSRLNLDRAQKLLALATPQARVDQFKAELAQANASVAQVQSVIDQKLIKAPFDGDLGIRRINLGQYVSAGDAIVTLTDLSTLLVNFTLPEQTRAQLSEGQTVEVRTTAYPETAFVGTLSAIEPVIGEDTRTIRVQASLPNDDGRLNPGMFVKAAVVLPEQEPQIQLPETAVEFSIYGDSVYIVKEKEAAEGQPQAEEPSLVVERLYVKTGSRHAGTVVVTEGLEEGARVVTSGQVNISSGAPVTLSDNDPHMNDTAPKEQTLY